MSFRPADNFWRVGGCLALSATASGGGGLSVQSNGPQGQQACVEGAVEPFTQPQPIVYSAVANLGSVTFDLKSGEQKTYTVRWLCWVEDSGRGARNSSSTCKISQRGQCDMRYKARTLYTVKLTTHAHTRARIRAHTLQVTSTATGTPIGGGAAVSASVDPPVTITVRAPVTDTTASMQSVELKQAEAQTASLSVSVGGYKTYVSDEYGWLLEASLDNGTADAAITLGVNELPRTVVYTLRATRTPPRDTKFFVYGKITVLNTGTTAVDVTDVLVTAGAATVPADCPPSAALAIPNVPLICSFNVSWNRGGAGGALGALVETPAGSFTGGPAAFDFSNAERGATRGAKAKVRCGWKATAARAPSRVGLPCCCAAGWFAAAALGLAHFFGANALGFAQLTTNPLAFTPGTQLLDDLTASPPNGTTPPPPCHHVLQLVAHTQTTASHTNSCSTI